MHLPSADSGLEGLVRFRSHPLVGRGSAAIFIRRGLRALCCVEIFLRGLPVFFRLRASGESNWRALWAQWISREFLRLINCKVRVSGAIPQHGLIVCNHLSYLDILAMLSVCQAVFVSKSDVRRWPFFGLLARMAGTVFVDRGRRTAVFVPLKSITCALKAGHPVVIFPEGTSSDGLGVLPFRSSLLEAAIVSRVPITPAAIDYDLKEGSISRRGLLLARYGFRRPFLESPGQRVCHRLASLRAVTGTDAGTQGTCTHSAPRRNSAPRQIVKSSRRQA